MQIGGHVSMAGGIEKAPERGAAIGANVIQIFGSSPRSFKSSHYSEKQLQQFQENAKKHGITDIFFHGVYLINLASIDNNYRETSIHSLIQYLELSHAIRGKGVIFHPGFKNTDDHDLALRNIILSCQEILHHAPSDQLLVIENSAGSSGQMCSTLEELAQITSGVNHDRLRFCIDTQHSFAAGINLATADGIENFTNRFDTLIGWEKVAAVHTNDSKTELGSHLDRHENIGKGKLGLEAFRLLLNHEKWRHLPFILEVPGVTGKGPDKENVDVLQSLIGH